MRRTAERVRVTAQLIRVSDQTHRWAECYERDLGDVLLLQSEIARAIAREIQVSITPEGTRRLAGARPLDSQAHEAYLKGLASWHRLSREHLELALQYFQLALEKDPSYALGHAGVANVWFSRGDCGLVSPGQAFPEAKAAALRAKELDDSLTEVHVLLANVYQKRIHDKALTAAARFFDLLGDDPIARSLEQGYREAGYMAAMRLAAKTRRGAFTREPRPGTPRCRLHAHAGNTDRALEWLEKVYEAHEPPLVHLRVSWDWDGLRAHPRFEDLLRRMNFPL